MKLSELRILRRLFLPLFAKINLGDISITHHYTGEKIRND
jgi:hypothetical protein